MESGFVAFSAESIGVRYGWIESKGVKGERRSAGGCGCRREKTHVNLLRQWEVGHGFMV